MPGGAITAGLFVLQSASVPALAGQTALLDVTVSSALDVRSQECASATTVCKVMAWLAGVTTASGGALL